MLEKGSEIVCVKSAPGITLDKQYTVIHFTYGQSPEYDRVTIENDKGYIEVYFAAWFKIATPIKS